MFVHINVDNLLNTGDRNMSMFDTKLDYNCTIYFTGMKYCLHVNDYKILTVWIQFYNSRYLQFPQRFDNYIDSVQ